LGCNKTLSYTPIEVLKPVMTEADRHVVFAKLGTKRADLHHGLRRCSMVAILEDI
jgi:hypothetical protein